MALKKTLMIAGAVTSIGLAGSAFGVNAVSAETEEVSGPFGMTSLASKIADRFNLNEGEVQEVFEEHKDDMEAEHKARMEERLTQAVTDGKLTEEQKAKILAKFEELKAQRPSLDGVKEASPGERRQIKLEKHDELEKWAEENDIPEEYVHFGPMVVHMEHKP